MGYPETLRVDVSQYCIDNGQPEETTSCPIALAVRKMYPDSSISVDGDLNIDGYRYFSDVAMEFVSKFDSGMSVQPQAIIFTMESDED